MLVCDGSVVRIYLYYIFFSFLRHIFFSHVHVFNWFFFNIPFQSLVGDSPLFLCDEAVFHSFGAQVSTVVPGHSHVTSFMVLFRVFSYFENGVVGDILLRGLVLVFVDLFFHRDFPIGFWDCAWMQLVLLVSENSPFHLELLS